MLRTLSSRRTLPVALLAAGALLLAGCGGDDKPKADPTETPSASESPSDSPTAGIEDKDGDGCADFKSGDQAKGVTVTGAVGKDLKATFTLPFKAEELERTLLTTGKGAKTVKGTEYRTHISAFKGSDGSSIGAQDLSMTAGDSSTLGAFAAAVDCVPIGSRVIVTVPAKDVYGPSGSPDAGIAATDSLVIVTDVIGKVVPLKPAAWTDPRVKVDFSGATPKLTLPPGAPSPKFLLKVLKPGTGDVVAKGDSVTLDYQGTSWNTKKLFDQSYGKQPATFATTQVVEGFGAALVGQKVGTRLVVTIPPKYGYGEGKINATDLKGQTLVFVIEIKSTAKS